MSQILWAVVTNDGTVCFDLMPFHLHIYMTREQARDVRRGMVQAEFDQHGTWRARKWWRVARFVEVPS